MKGSKKENTDVKRLTDPVGVMGLDATEYPQEEHVAKNALPLCYVDYLARAWLEATGRAQGVADYSNYDAEMDESRRRAANHEVSQFQ